MSQFPNNLDDDTTLPFVNDNITEIGGEAINALRDAVFNVEQNIGLNAHGSTLSIADRLGISLNPDGTIKSSAIASLGLVTLPITGDQISATAEIDESKLKLDHKTQDLFNYIQNLSLSTTNANSWISMTGSKLNPHLAGALYRHTLDHIDIGTNSSLFLKNKFRLLRNNSNSYNLINDINNELLYHQFADGYVTGATSDIQTNNGDTYPSNYAHTASGVYLNTDRFAVIPQTAQDLQQLAEFIDSSSIFLYGTRIQNLYTNGISRVSRSSSLTTDGYGSPVIPSTPAIAYLLNDGTASSPVDDITNGDDIIEFKPSSGDMASNSFDEKFALVKAGDILRINYGTVEVQFLIKEKKYIQSIGNKKYIVRIAGKNLFYTTTASARIDRSLVNSNKYGVLGVAVANNSFAQTPSLIIGSPRGAQALGLSFNPDQFDTSHYLLYLALYPTGNPNDGYTILPGIDVTGNRGTTSGVYTLDSIVQSTNDAFRKSGYNYRFIAFAYQGNFGIMLADPYGNAGFSILSAVVDGNGAYNQTATNVAFQNNVVGMFAPANSTAPDPLGFGPLKAALASPPYLTSYGSPEAALNPTKLFLPLVRNNYYVNGTEREKLHLEINQLLDNNGDGYWIGTITAQNIVPGTSGHIQTTYRVDADLCTSGLKNGKTLVIQSLGSGSLNDFGRFTIQNLNYSCGPNFYSDITVYDSVHATGISPSTVLPIGSQVAIYFNYDSVSFNDENANDATSVSPFKRFFEVLIDQDGRTFTHERARINASSSTIISNDVPLFASSELSKLDIVAISPKLRGYQFGSVNKITLYVSLYDTLTGILDGYLASYDGVSLTKCGNKVSGKKGEVIRFYDESNIDYIDVIFNVNNNLNTLANEYLDFQLFPSLSLDEEVMPLATCQLNGPTNYVSMVKDVRQFGNTSEKDLSTSALNLFSLPEKLLHVNGVVRGFDLDSSLINPNNGQIFLKGGTALVNGKLLQINNQTVTIPMVKELDGILYNVNWAVCVNDKGELQSIPLLDYDSNLGTPLNTERIFKAYNLSGGTVYYLDALTFAQITNTRSDLTILYIASATVSNTPSITLSVNDVRKFVANESANIPITLTSSDSKLPAHFNSFNSVINWVNKFGANNNTIVVKGSYDINSSVNLLNINYPVTIKGENAIFNITAPKGFLVNKNITFENITFNYDPIGFTTSGIINSENGCIYGDASSGSVNDIVIKNCKFTSQINNHPPYISFRIAKEQYVNNIDILSNRFDDANSDTNCIIAFVGTYEGSSYTYPPTVGNILIQNNICLQKQIIAFTSAFTTTNSPGLAGFNLRILGNTFGYLGFSLNSGPTPNPNIPGVSYRSLTIQNNSLIAILNPISHTGQFVTSNLNNSSLGIDINNNSLNFLLLQFQSTNDFGSVIVTNNRFRANDFATLMTIFGITFTPGFMVGVSTGIYIKASGYNLSYTSKIKISNNILTNNITNITTYWYSIPIYVYGCSADIYKNTITNLFGNTANNNVHGILLDGTSGMPAVFKINENSISRGSNSINAYITNLSTGNIGEIIGNYFDSKFVNVGNTDINTININPNPNNFTVFRNKNHVVTSIIRPYYFQHSSVSIDSSFNFYVADGIISSFNSSFDFRYVGNGLSKTGIYYLDLKEVIPIQAKVYKFELDASIFQGTQATSVDITLYLKKRQSNTDVVLTNANLTFLLNDSNWETHKMSLFVASNEKIDDLYLSLNIAAVSPAESGTTIINFTALKISYFF